MENKPKKTPMMNMLEIALKMAKKKLDEKKETEK